MTRQNKRFGEILQLSAILEGIPANAEWVGSPDEIHGRLSAQEETKNALQVQENSGHHAYLRRHRARSASTNLLLMPWA